MSKAMNNGGTISKRQKKGRNGEIYEYWEARITTGYDPATGKQTQRSFTAKTQSEARQRMQAALNELNTHSYYEPKKITVADWLELWLKEYCADKKPKTIEQYKASVKNHIVPAIGKVKLTELNAVHLQSFFNQLAKKKASGKQNKGKDKALSPKTVKNVHGTLSKALNTAVMVGFIPNNPAEHITLPKVQKKEIHPLTEAQMQSFLKLAADDEYFTVYKLILFTGLRESEAIGLTWDCIDFKKGTIKIYRQLQRLPNAAGGYVFAPLKNSKTRTFKPAKGIMQMLKEKQREQLNERMAAGEAWVGFRNAEEHKTALVFTNAEGKHLNITVLYNHYKKLADAAGAPASRVHDLRHTYATIALQNGVDAKTVSETLGHATVAFTLDVYGHVSEAMQNDSSAKMERYMQSIC